MLEHHPLTREDFGDLGRDERVRRELLARVMAAIAAAVLQRMSAAFSCSCRLTGQPLR
jgi:hypothetical protein